MPLYSPPGMYAWDFWIVRVPRGYHLFHLQASRRLPAGLRHFHASVGHAFSRDLSSWEYRGTVLAPGRPGEWDDRAIWTGSILEDGGRYWFLYTALRRGDGGIQRIGLAVSDDLERFEKHSGNPVLRADPRWYATCRGFPKVEDWRDPYLVRLGGRTCALITATLAPPSGTSRGKEAAARAGDLLALSPLDGLARRVTPPSLAGRGCVALATTEDFVRWEVRPPLFAPGRYSHMECPEIFERDGLFYLTFSTFAGWYHPDWDRRIGGGRTGMHAYVAPRPEGPYEPVNGTGIVLGTETGAYATRVILPDDGNGSWRAMTWRLFAPGSRRFCGRITSPFPLAIQGTSIQAAPVPGE